MPSRLNYTVQSLRKLMKDGKESIKGSARNIDKLIRIAGTGSPDIRLDQIKIDIPHQH